MANQEHHADVATWQAVWEQSDEQLASRRLERERASSRWANLRRYINEAFGARKLNCVELGSGEGDFSVLMAQLGHEVTLVDFTPKALERARLRFASLGLDAKFIQADLFEFTHEHAGRYDVSMSVGLAEHFSGRMRDAVIHAHREVLRENGVAFISVPNHYCLSYRLRKLYMELRGTWPYGFEAPFSARELRRIAKRTGFGVCNTYNTGFAAGVDGCLLQPLTGKSLGWQDGPAWANALNGWVVNLVAKAA